MKFSNYEIRRVIYVISSVIFVLLAGIIYLFNKGNDELDLTSDIVSETSVPYSSHDPEPESFAADNEVIIYITGAIKNPGVYSIKSDGRINDAVIASGGFKKSAAKDSINLAQKINDGDQIHIPTKKEIKNRDIVQDSPSSDEGNKVNINTATKEQLMSVPGIGESKADAIISFRDSNGSFSSTEGLKEISGIKDGVYNKIAPYITV